MRNRPGDITTRIVSIVIIITLFSTITSPSAYPYKNTNLMPVRRAECVDLPQDRPVFLGAVEPLTLPELVQAALYIISLFPYAFISLKDSVALTIAGMVGRGVPEERTGQYLDLKYGDETVKVYYEKHGEGSAAPVVFVHGLGGTSGLWDEAVKALNTHRESVVYSLDLPGFGYSERPQAECTTAGYADLVDKFCESQNISGAVLVGHSMGGGVLIKYYEKYGNREDIKGLILVNSSGLPIKTADAEIIRQLYDMPVGNLICRIFLKYLIGNPRLLKKWAGRYPDVDHLYRHFLLASSKSIGRLAHEIMTLNLQNELSGIDVPTIIIWGKEDPIIPVARGYKMQESIPGSEMTVLEGAAHFSQLAPGFPDTVLNSIRSIEAASVVRVGAQQFPRALEGDIEAAESPELLQAM